MFDLTRRPLSALLLSVHVSLSRPFTLSQTRVYWRSQLSYRINPAILWEAWQGAMDSFRSRGNFALPAITKPFNAKWFFWTEAWRGHLDFPKTILTLQGTWNLWLNTAARRCLAFCKHAKAFSIIKTLNMPNTFEWISNCSLNRQMYPNKLTYQAEVRLCPSK